ncbi:MAG: V-type ATP synthase subunit D, partial [Pseudomonadales bacterium]
GIASMQKLALNKSALSAEKNKFRSYEKYLPSLELKQKQLLFEAKKHETQLLEHQEQLAAIQQGVYQRLPMMAIENIDLSGLVEITGLQIESENLLGTLLPRLGQVEYRRKHYSYLARPHWVDEVASSLEHIVKLKIEENILAERLNRIKKATQTITQRVNLFSKVLMPRSRKNIKQISIFLADQDRAAVVRSKLAKQKHQGQGAGGEF